MLTNYCRSSKFHSFLLLSAFIIACLLFTVLVMALRNTVAVSFIIMMIFFGACSATVYTVGGDLNGWTDSGAVDYHEWASSKKFYVGDEFHI